MQGDWQDSTPAIMNTGFYPNNLCQSTIKI